MHLYRYKKKIWQCEIPLAHTGSIASLQALPPSLAKYIRSPVQPVQDTNHKVPAAGARKAERQTSPDQNAARAAALAAIQHITQPLP